MVELGGSKRLFGSLLLFFATAAVVYSVNNNSAYKGAVYEHIPVKPTSMVNITRSDALRVIRRNLATYESRVKQAAIQRTDIIVFPEYGLFGVFDSGHESIHPFLETVPEVERGKWNPCNEKGLSDDYIIQKTLSCLAKAQNLYIVASLGEKSECNQKLNKCHSHKFYHYSTTVVFSNEGYLVAKYRRKALLKEPYFDSPHEFNIAVFETEENKFAIVSSYDTMLKEPVTELIKKRRVKNIIVPNVWRSESPLLSSVQWHSSWATGNKVNVLAATIHDKNIRSYGTGIYSPYNEIDYYNEPDTQKGNLIIRDVKLIGSLTPNAEDIPHLSVSADRFSYHNIQLLGQSVKFKFVEMKDSVNEISICSGSFCCNVYYIIRFEELGNFGLGIFKGYITALNRNLSFEICTVVNCKGGCGKRNSSYNTYFKVFELSGINFTADRVYPQMVVIENDDQILNRGWNYANGKMKIRDQLSNPFHSATLIGRNYHEDKSLQNKNTFSKDRKPHGTSTAKRNDAVSGFTPTVFVIGMASVLSIINFS